ncbi:energy transducer TonB [Helicobacter burdigaliensis]|uniref:energy transducer TonB n=1 Tax=Helicobacter burdigaliensis TaxID=2315334 RepID=UPI000EF75794|nr:energy transducer TonB [Helicobacter burdigaliensis]
MKTLVLQPKNNSTEVSFLISCGIYFGIFMLIFLAQRHFIPKDVGLQTTTLAISLKQFSESKQTQAPKAQEMAKPKPIEEKPIIKPIQKPIVKPIAKPKPQNKPIVKQRAEPKMATNEKPQPQTTEQTAQANHTPNVSQKSSSVLTFGKNNDPFLIAIKQAIDANLDYPRKARMMRAVGVVLVEFKLLGGGGVEDIRVIKGSTHAILDNSSIKTIKKASYSFPAPKKDVIIRIPIEYNLRQG